MNIGIIIILLLGSCSTVKEDRFLDNVKSKVVFIDVDKSEIIGKFSEDSRIFSYDKKNDLIFMYMERENVAFYRFSTEEFSIIFLGDKIEFRNARNGFLKVYYL